MIVIWIVLYFAVGLILAKGYHLENDILKLLVFFGWPILVVGFMAIFVLLLAFGLVFAADELMYWLINHNRTGKGNKKL